MTKAEIITRIYEKVGFSKKDATDVVEATFDIIRPSKAPSKHRLYKKRDVELLLDIKRLLYTEGFTIEGARKKLKETKKEEKDQLKLPLAEQKYKSALVKLRKDLESLRKL